MLILFLPNMNQLLNFFQILSSIATTIAVYYTYLTLKEVKVQRESMYMPDLIIEEKKFYLYGYQNEKGIVLNEFSYENKELNYRSDKSLFYNFSIDLNNIGLGTAKNIDVKFKFNISDAILIINKMNNKVDVSKKINIKKTKYSIGFSGGIESTQKKSMHIIKNQFETKINHILPISISGTSVKINLPQVIQELYSISVTLFWLINKEEQELYKFPSIFLYFQYYDIGNKKHTKKHELNLKFYGGTNLKNLNKLEIK